MEATNLSQALKGQTHSQRKSLFLAALRAFKSRLGILDVFGEAAPDCNLSCGSFEELSSLFERYVCEHEAKHKGVFYTPQSITNDLIDYCFDLSPNLTRIEHRKLRVIDPACGSGAFLINFARRYWSQKRLDESARAYMLEHCLFGFDADPIALELCRLGLSLEAVSPPDGVGNQLALLRESPKTGNLVLGDSLVSQKLTSLYNTFDLILGNPPYGISRDGKITDAEKLYYRKQFPEFIYKKINKYILFLGLAYRLLKPGGILAMLVPNSFLGIENAKALRKVLLVDGALRDIVVYDYKVFSNAQVEAIAVIAQKEAQRKQIRTIRKNAQTEIISEVRIPYRVCFESSDYRIPIFSNSHVGKFLDQIEAISLLPADLGIGAKIALQAYAAGKGHPPQTRSDGQQRKFHSREKLDESSFPYLEGRDLARFAVNWSGSYLRYGKFLAEHQPIERFSKPRVILREILAADPYCLVCAFTDQVFLYNRSILHLIADRPLDSALLKGLAALLNSAICGNIMRLRGRKSDRKLFPKILQADLKEFTIPKVFAERYPEFASLYDQIATSAPKDRTDLQSRLDDLARDIYELSSSSLTLIKAA